LSSIFAALFAFVQTTQPYWMLLINVPLAMWQPSTKFCVLHQLRLKISPQALQTGASLPKAVQRPCMVWHHYKARQIITQISRWPYFSLYSMRRMNLTLSATYSNCPASLGQTKTTLGTKFWQCHNKRSIIHSKQIYL
jgi:hypothetical protein